MEERTKFLSLARPVSFRILLKKQNEEKLEQIFWEVNNPASSKWGNFLSREEVEGLTAPSAESKKVVKNWLKTFNVRITERSDYFEVKGSPAEIERMFETKMIPFVKPSSGKKMFRIWGDASVPSHIFDHIQLITGLSELFSGQTKFSPQTVNTFASLTKPSSSQQQKQKVKADDQDILITPSVLRSYYQIPEGQKGSMDSNSQSIAAFDDYFSIGALKKFAEDQNFPAPNVTIHGPDCFLTDNCDQYESDLDVQYVTALGLNVSTTFYNHAQGLWILGWAQEINALDKPALVHSLSYGWSELSQCDITQRCPTLGYDSKQYVDATNTELKKLGVRGATVLVSDGDDGAASLGASTGNCPMDANYYCKAGGCAHTYTKCAEFTISLNGLNCNFPMGVGSAACRTVLNQTSDDAIAQFFSANSACSLNLEQDVQKNPYFFSECTCDKIKNVTADGLAFSAYQFSPENGGLFTADYPTSSPYVTSVGATQFISDDSGRIVKEIACSIKTGAIITTGGGFSSFQPQFAAQKGAVSDFISNAGSSLPPSFSYDTSKRAYPDISFNGHKYKVFASNNTEDPSTCPCFPLPVDGTSASSPALAGFLSLVNDLLLAKGMSPLGYLNPLLYQIYGSSSYNTIFNDILEGDNFCTRAYCCQYGWTAQKGWDPVTGLGSPKFQPFVDYVVKSKIQNRNRHASIN
jgi:subtilase family serine protease